MNFCKMTIRRIRPPSRRTPIVTKAVRNDEKSQGIVIETSNPCREIPAPQKISSRQSPMECAVFHRRCSRGFLFSLGSLADRVAPPNSFDGADSVGPDHSHPHGQTRLPVPPRIVPLQAKHVQQGGLRCVLARSAYSGYWNRKPQVSMVMCSAAVRGYLRQFIGRNA